MKLILAAPRGYCAGVAMAVAALDRAVSGLGPPIYAYHQIVHNRHLVNDFQRRGVIFVDSLDAVPDGATLFYSAHGVAREIREESRRKSLKVLDATCPLVMKVHAEARRFAAEQRIVILVGHAGHDEVVGVASEVPQRRFIVSTPADVDALPDCDGQPIAYVTQTTLSTTETESVIARLRERFPTIEGPPKEDICYATTNRQRAVRTIAAEVQLVLVVGSENSSNSQRLVDAARDCGARAYRIDGPEEIDFDWFSDVTACCLTAGASVPETVVEATVAALASRVDLELEERVTAVETLRFAPPVLER